MTWAGDVAALSPLIWWRLGEASGLVASDSSGNGRDGNIATNGTGGAPWQGEPGAIDGDPDTSTHFFWPSSPNNHMRGVSFGPAVDHPEIRVQHAGKLAAGIWYKSETDYHFGQGALMRVSNPGANASDSSWRLNILADGNLEIRGRDTGTPPATTGINVLDGRWHFIGGEWEHDGVNYARRIYVDGVLRASSTATYEVTATDSQHLRVGYSAYGTVNQQRLSGWYDEFFLLDHHLTADQWRDLYIKGSGGKVHSVGPDVEAQVPTAHVMYGQIVTARTNPIQGSVGPTSNLTEPITPESLSDPETLPGPLAPIDLTAIYISSLDDPEDLPGPQAPIIPGSLDPIRPLSLFGTDILNGPFIPDPEPDPDDEGPVIIIPVPPSPDRPDGNYFVSAKVSVSASANATVISSTPTRNAVGTGQFTCLPPGPANDSTVTFRAAGQTTMTGIVTARNYRETSPGEEADELVDVTCAATAHELSYIRILPDFGSMDLSRLGPPTQDIRTFNWTANGLGDWSGVYPERGPGELPGARSSQSVDMIYADEEGLFSLPDNWPDNSAKWMSAMNPVSGGSLGWQMFRVPTPKNPEGPVQFWLCAHDYAELWVDGTHLITCETPGVAKDIQIEDTRNDWHLIAIRAWSRSGQCAVAFTMLPVRANGLFGPPTMNSRGGWWATVDAEPYIYSPGGVLHRIMYEARERGNQVARGWNLAFTNQNDSAGVPWEDGPVIEMDVGMTVLEALDRLSEDRIDWHESPAGRTLYAYNKGTVVRNRSLPWTKTVDLIARDYTEESQR